jgi:CRP-like cAMP-binding protein
MHALRGEYIMEEGKPGRELYMILKGELEVFKRDDRNIEQRLGFLSEGSFFGESAVLSDSSGKEVRSRTLKAVTDSELCFLTRESLLKLRREYSELEARLKRFVNVGPLRLTRKGVMEKIFSHEILSNPTDGQPADARQQLQSLTADFEDMRQAIKSTEENGSPRPTATMLKRTTSRAALKLRSAMLLMKTEGGRSLASSKSAPPVRPPPHSQALHAYPSSSATWYQHDL